MRSGPCGSRPTIVVGHPRSGPAGARGTQHRGLVHEAQDGGDGLLDADVGRAHPADSRWHTPMRWGRGDTQPQPTPDACSRGNDFVRSYRGPTVARRNGPSRAPWIVLVERLQGSKAAGIGPTTLSRWPKPPTALRCNAPTVTLRIPEPGDATALYRLASDPEVTKWFSWGPYQETAEARAYIDRLPDHAKTRHAARSAAGAPRARSRRDHRSLRVLLPRPPRDGGHVVRQAGLGHRANLEGKALMAYLSFDCSASRGSGPTPTPRTSGHSARSRRSGSRRRGSSAGGTATATGSSTSPSTACSRTTGATAR